MRFIILIGLLISFAFSCKEGCREYKGKPLARDAIKKFKSLDKQTSKEIGKIVKQMKKAHKDLEVRNKILLMQTRDIMERYYVTEKNIVFNQRIINSLKDVLITKKAEENIKGLIKK